MVKKNYHSEFADAKGTAKAVLKNKNVSLKFSTEICREIKSKRLDKAQAFLNRVMKHEEHLPLRKYNKKVAHRKGEAKSQVKSGRYPEKTVAGFLDLLQYVKANADYKGMDAENLLIADAFASQGYARMGSQSKGRIAGKSRQRKSAHLEIVVREAK